VFVSAPALDKGGWQAAEESMPGDAADWVAIGQPREQLAFTKNKTDYAWYKSELLVEGDIKQNGTVVLQGINDFFQIFMDGTRVAVSNMHLPEDRGPWDGDDYRQAFDIELEPGKHQLAVLACSLGLVKGDWQAGRRNMVEERKGFWGHVSWRPTKSSLVENVCFGEWFIHAGLDGEQKAIPATLGRSTKWRQLEADDQDRPLRWYRMEFQSPSGSDPVAFNFGSLGKGLAWVNGECIGRYWTVRSVAPEKIHTEHNQVMRFDPPGEPSQSYYHVPRGWLRAGKNVLIIFEETGGKPGKVELMKWQPDPRTDSVARPAV
jgi:beta-galactosidase